LNTPPTTIHFASDLHLGAPNAVVSKVREKLFVQWLEEVACKGDALHLVGDTLDFWFEWKHVVPRGHVRIFGALAALVDAGIPVHWHVGNHDLWTFGYLEQELGVEVHREPIELEVNGDKWLVGHGDGLGPGDNKYKMLKRIFTSATAQWAFSRLHPNLAVGLAQRWSRSSRIHNADSDAKFNGIEGEWLAHYIRSEEQLRIQRQVAPRTGYIFGHRHLPIDETLDVSPGGKLDGPNRSTRYINTGEWLTHRSYLRIDPQGAELLRY
jgi:UDP-2,3-diacylglucosamine hydrolase